MLREIKVRILLRTKRILLQYNIQSEYPRLNPYKNMDYNIIYKVNNRCLKKNYLYFQI